jgi:hypothetical protein
MTPFAHLALGFGIVVVDIRTDTGFDIVMDPLGWLACIFAFTRLAHTRERYTLAKRASYAGLLLSASEALPLGLPDALPSAATSIAESCFVFGVCSAIIKGLAVTAVTGKPKDKKASHADLLRWSHVGFTTILVILLLLSLALDSALGSTEVLVTMLPLLLLSLWLLVLIFGLRRDPNFAT